MKKSASKSRFFLYHNSATNSLTLIQLQQISCYCSSKTRKSESNSQHRKWTLWPRIRCYCSSNTRKSESNSQLKWCSISAPNRCYCSSKTNKIRLFGNTKTANILEIPFLLPSNNHELIFMMPRLDILR